MRYITLVLTLLVLVFLTSRAPVAFQNPQQTPAKPLYQPTGYEAVLTGTIMLNGEVPKPLRYDMTADPVCMEHNPEPVYVDTLLTSNQRLLNVFIYVKGGETLQAHRFEVPDSEVVLAHKNCSFSPHVLGIRVGQRLSIVNSDATVHNTHPTPRLNREWNQSQGVGSAAIVKTFDHPEQFIPIKDNQHPWQRAFLGVFDHPFFAVSDAFGNYEIRGLPPGNYKLVAWHEQLGEKEIELTVVGGENRRVDFTFDSSAQRNPRW
jgi:plastocyanin